ncbi:HAD family hydrolase [Thiomicrorhabdus sp. zzn3]|uniref:HAD family hydrolase n=1 Tax=Thiomicrorhabdus sp. zzn3 TaxID=3039775 RepID=UPI0024370980|nr:HAD family hydrolase [Thiomicrorhabdus sp. zzn3]MDG6778362.1 HAD family hydrolase [Thiomicrorhabdus sp. zzn3]
MNSKLNLQLRQAVDLVVCDLDGTLLNPDHKVTPRTIAAVRALVDQGVQFMIATGRHYQDVYLIAQQLGVEMDLITSNGARVHDRHGRVLYENHMPENLVREVLEISSGFEIHRNLYQQDLWLVEEPHEELLAIHDTSGFEYQLTDFAQLDLTHIDKIYFTAAHEVLQPLEHTLRRRFANQLSITFTSPEYLEIMNFGVCKGRALEMILEQKALRPERTVALGDGMNDKEMLQLAGYPVVMANAAESVKTWLNQAGISAHIARANSEEGVAHYLETVLLPKLKPN